MLRSANQLSIGKKIKIENEDAERLYSQKIRKID